jgi:hypothetical protein
VVKNLFQRRNPNLSLHGQHEDGSFHKRFDGKNKCLVPMRFYLLTWIVKESILLEGMITEYRVSLLLEWRCVAIAHEVSCKDFRSEN